MAKNIVPLADSLKRASFVLEGRRKLLPGTPEYERLYVERPQLESQLIGEIAREAGRAEQAGHSFHWCVTGHMGSGKSTELHRLMADPQLGQYLSVYSNLQIEFDLQHLDYTDLFLAMARACAAAADRFGFQVPKPLRQAIDRWGSEFFTEEEIHTRTEGEAGLKVALPFVALGEEVRSGGGKREVIRRTISTDLIEFTRLIDQLAETLQRHTGHRVLCVLDGLDHMAAGPAYQLLNDHFRTFTLPRVSKILVVPLTILNTPFLATIEDRYSTVPNVKVFEAPGSKTLDAAGFTFYREVISRYAPLELFTEEALVSLCQLSAGIVRDMIRSTGDAAYHADKAGSPRVRIEHVEPVWHRAMRYYTNLLTSEDYEVLRRVEQDPLLEGGNEGVPRLLQLKAVVFYPNARGWYGVHPAVRRMLEEAAGRK